AGIDAHRGAQRRQHIVGIDDARRPAVIGGEALLVVEPVGRIADSTPALACAIGDDGDHAITYRSLEDEARTNTVSTPRFPSSRLPPRCTLRVRMTTRPIGEIRVDAGFVVGWLRLKRHHLRGGSLFGRGGSGSLWGRNGEYRIPHCIYRGALCQH